MSNKVLAGAAAVVCVMSALGVATTAKADASVPVQAQWSPCANDEAEGGPCVWDHKHMGNKIGRSFKLTATNKVVFITHKRAHSLLNNTNV